MPRITKFGRGKEKKTYPINFSQRKRTKITGSEELGCSSEESAVGLQNGINVHISEDKIMPPCVTPDKIDDETEVKDSIPPYSRRYPAIRYRTSRLRG